MAGNVFQRGSLAAHALQCTGAPAAHSDMRPPDSRRNSPYCSIAYSSAFNPMRAAESLE